MDAGYQRSPGSRAPGTGEMDRECTRWGAKSLAENGTVIDWDFHGIYR